MPAAVQALTELESRLFEQLSTQFDQAEALANANVHAAEMIIQNDDLAAEREERNKRLQQRQEEIEAKAAAVADANVEAALKIVEAEDKATVMEERAYVDGMTGLFNHRYFKEQIGIEFARAHRYERDLSVVFIDIDHFKKLNDTHGHPVGDEVLTEVGELVQSTVRTADVTVRADGEPFAVRYGGEEFVLILPETDLPGAEIVAERVRSKIESTTLPGGHTQPLGRVTISAGVACLREGDDDVATLVERADEALYKAKTGGRNRIVLDSSVSEA